MSSRAEFSNGSSDYSQAALEGGININDWMLRSHQFLTQTNGTFSNQNSSTYLQRTFTDLKTLMRAGEVNLNNSVLEGASIYGIEIAPDNALQTSGSGVQVTGIANTSQARVEIRQQGVLIHSILVPAGAFTILMYLFAMVIVILMSPLSKQTVVRTTILFPPPCLISM